MDWCLFFLRKIVFLRKNAVSIGVVTAMPAKDQGQRHTPRSAWLCFATSRIVGLLRGVAWWNSLRFAVSLFFLEVC